MTANPIRLLFRHVVQARLEALFRRGDRVFDLGCGTGEDALTLAARGVRVVGIDPSPERIARAREKASERGLGPEECRFELAVLISLLGPWPLPAVIRRTLTGMGDPRRGRAPRVGHAAPALSYPTLAQARAALGPALDWTDAYALGVLVPGPDQKGWVADHPQAFGMLAALERAVRRWPGLRQLGDHTVLEGRRKE